MVAILLCSVTADQDKSTTNPKSDGVPSGSQGSEQGELSNTQQEVKKDESQPNEKKQKDTSKEENKQEEVKQEESKQQETKQEEIKQEEVKQEKVKQEESKQEETKQEEVKQEAKNETDQQEVGGDSFERDGISYAFKGAGDVWRTTEENEKYMLSYLTAWADHVSTMNSVMLNYEINAGSTITFYEDIKKVPQKLKGVYSVPGEKTTSVMLTITDPYNNVIMIKSGAKDMIFYPELKIPGRYTLQLKNNNVILPFIS
jgi:hypothetical protein